MSDKGTVLIVEDEKRYCNYYRESLAKSKQEYHIETVTDLRTADTKLKDLQPDVVILDLRFPPRHKPEEGLTFLKHIREFDSKIKVIIVTGASDRSIALKSIELGACDFVQKDPDIRTVLPFRVNQAYERLQLERELIEQRRSKIKEIGGFLYGRGQIIVGTSQRMLELYEDIRKFANTNSTVLITGETGTGKELIARALHYSSKRRDKPFATVNCAALPKELVESTLFGHERGAFTGAVAQHTGKFETASGGTLFLDEIGEMSSDIQAKLLRAIQEGEIERVGGKGAIKVDVRIIAATNIDLQKAVEQRDFREDLLYRINVIQLEIPPLRKREADIPILAEHFLARAQAELEDSILGFSEAAILALKRHCWPGNVRELENMIERAVIEDTDGWIGLDDLNISTKDEPNGRTEEKANNSDIQQLVAEISTVEDSKNLPKLKTFQDIAEGAYIEAILKRTGGNQTEAAKILGVNYTTLYRRMKKLQFDPSQA